MPVDEETQTPSAIASCWLQP